MPSCGPYVLQACRIQYSTYNSDHHMRCRVLIISDQVCVPPQKLYEHNVRYSKLISHRGEGGGGTDPAILAACIKWHYSSWFPFSACWWTPLRLSSTNRGPSPRVMSLEARTGLTFCQSELFVLPTVGEEGDSCTCHTRRTLSAETCSRFLSKQNYFCNKKQLRLNYLWIILCYPYSA